jgi:hypothetical protein
MSRKPGHEDCSTCVYCGLTNCPDCDIEGESCPLVHKRIEVPFFGGPFDGRKIPLHEDFLAETIIFNRPLNPARPTVNRIRHRYELDRRRPYSYRYVGIADPRIPQPSS